MNASRICLALFLLCVTSSVFASDVPVHISLKADSVPLVGKEGTVTVTATVDYDLPDVNVEITLPTEGKVVGQSKLVVARATKAAPIELQAKVTFATPGIKTVRAIVKSAEKPGVVWSAVAYVLLDVGANSSSILTDTSGIRTAPKLLGKGDGKSLGRPSAEAAAARSGARPKMTVNGGPDGLTPTLPDKLETGELVVTGTWSFRNRVNSPVGQRNALVELRSGGLFHVLLATTYTNWYGYFAFPAVDNPGAYGVFVRCYTLSDGVDNAAMVRYNTASDWYSADTDVYVFDDGTRSVGSWCVDDTNPNYKAWWIVDDMTKAYNVPPDPVGGHCVDWSPGSSGWAHYEVGGDIHLYGGDADDTPDTVLHEMGHSVMYNIYGDYMPDAPNCSPHSLLGHSSTGCAWTEGWAQIWHMWTTGNAIRSYPGGGGVDLEAATWGDGGDEGSDVEGRVAAAVWDIADSADDGYDHFTGGWLDIWHIMYHHNCDKFSEFWSQWQAHPFDTHGPIACIYQNTIDWNTAPTFSGLPDITIAEDEFRANAMDLDDYAYDPESQDYQLAFNIVNVSDPGLQIGINSNHEVNMQGVLNWNGTAIVQVSCSDGIVAQQDSFTVTVTPVNDPPVIKYLPDLSVDEDGSLYHAINLNLFTTDPETSPPSLTYSIRGNTNPSCGVTLVSSYYINVNPVANWFGTSDITVRATDPQGLYGEDTFRVTVNPVNDPPVITNLPDRTLPEDTSLDNTIDLWAYTTDVELPASALTYTIQSSGLPAGAVTIDSNRYIDINPPANYNGAGDVVVRAWDFENGWGEDTFRVTVTPVSDPPVIAGVPDQMYETTKVVTTHLVDLRRYASDPDGPVSELLFSVTGNTNAGLGATIDSNRYLKITHGALFSGHSVVTVRATDPTQQWSEDTLNVIVGRKCESCFEAFGSADGAWVFFNPKTVTVSHYYSFYMEDDARTSGIRVNSTANPDLNRLVTVGGQLTTYEGERAVDCTVLTLGGVDSTPPQPLGMTNKTMGGDHASANTRAVPEGRVGGLYNVGLLVRTTGKVVSRNSNSFWIDDGSDVPYSFSTHGLYVDCQPIAMYAPTLGSRVTVTGASGAGLMGGNTINTLRLRNRLDVKGLGGRAVYVYNTAASTAAVFAAMLANQGWTTTTRSVSTILSADLSAYDVVILGADTGNWTDMAKVNYIVNSDKPVIAMGAGGARFLDQAPGLYLGWGNSQTELLRQGYVDNYSNVLYWWDNIISLPTGNILDMLVVTATTTELYSPPAGVYGLLRHPTSSLYWTVAQEGRFMQWGYDTLPSNMNQVAKDLLVNSLYYMQGK